MKSLAKHKKPLLIGTGIFVMIFVSIFVMSIFFDTYRMIFQSPILFQTPVLIELRNEILSPLGEASPSATLRVIPKAEAKEIHEWKGLASYYSHKGCLGCSDGQIMANGEPFDETAMTVAFNKLPLGSFVRVTNRANGMSIKAEITDTGGFEELGRIADLSKGVKEMIGCNDICSVKIEELL